MVITKSALSVGIDNKFVHQVIHYSGAYSSLYFAQEGGGAGRDGRSCTSLVLTKKPNQALRPSAKLGDMQAYLFTQGCRRVVLESFLDGKHGDYCNDGEELCDLCLKYKGEGTSALSKMSWKVQIPALMSKRSKQELVHNHSCEKLHSLTVLCSLKDQL